MDSDVIKKKTTMSKQEKGVMKRVIVFGMIAVLLISFCFIMVGCLAFGTATTKGIDNPNHGTMYFGNYPQTKVTDKNIISALGTFDSATWASYSYYVDGEVSDCMYYIDKTYQGCQYRGVYIASYRPDECDKKSSANNTYQSDNGYQATRVYWFKYEPIKWDVVKEEDGNATLVADIILDSQAFDFEEGEAYNNYAESTIRRWLNESFYNTAFSESEKETILTTKIDNSASSTEDLDNPYVCEDTYDKIYLLSYVEANTYYEKPEERIKTSSNYARCQGLRVGDEGEFFTNVDSEWWLRSPNEWSNHRQDLHTHVFCVSNIGYVFDWDDLFIYRTYMGVVPSLVIKL